MISRVRLFSRIDYMQHYTTIGNIFTVISKNSYENVLHPMLMIKCKACGKGFPSSLDYDKHSFETANIVEQAEICPHCNAVTICNWEDYFFEE